MPAKEILILAMTKMLSGICTAGFSCEQDAVTGLCWVRPTREFGAVLPGDMMDAEGNLMQCCDVVELELIEPRPDPPHVEDWIADFVHHRPKRLRRLEGEKRADFFANYVDGAPQDVLCTQTRSLCLVHPDEVWAQFSLDAYSGRYSARMGFTLPGEAQHPDAQAERGAPVTDLKWRALGRAWLGEDGGELRLDQGTLMAQLSADDLYLTVGLSRKWQGRHWLLVHAIHAVPDYVATIDLRHP